MRRFRFEIERWEDPDGGRAGRAGRWDRSDRSDRSPVLAQAFARIEVAWRIDDPDAAFRVLSELQATPEGEWLSQVMAAVTVHQFSVNLRRVPRQLDNDQRS